MSKPVGRKQPAASSNAAGKPAIKVVKKISGKMQEKVVKKAGSSAKVKVPGDKTMATETPAVRASALKSVKAKAPAAARKPATKRIDYLQIKRNKRSGTTIDNILAATGEIILRSGADRISILDVCEQADISRGTFYRYFSSQEELLDAFSRHTRDSFHSALAEAIGQHTDPDDRFQAVMDFVEDFLENSRSRRLLIVAPEYAIRWLQRIFHDSVIRFQDVLRMTFDAWEGRAGIIIDRELVCELIVRYILSDILVPGGVERRTLPRRLERMIHMLLSGRIARR